MSPVPFALPHLGSWRAICTWPIHCRRGAHGTSGALQDCCTVRSVIPVLSWRPRAACHCLPVYHFYQYPPLLPAPGPYYLLLQRLRPRQRAGIDLPSEATLGGGRGGRGGMEVQPGEARFHRGWATLSTLDSTPGTICSTPSTLCGTPGNLCSTLSTLCSTPSTLCHNSFRLVIASITWNSSLLYVQV